MYIIEQYLIIEHFQVFSFQNQIGIFMSLEVENIELWMFFELQKQRNKAENAERKKMIFCFKFCP
jgi:hypothetical protein